MTRIVALATLLVALVGAAPGVAKTGVSPRNAGKQDTIVIKFRSPETLNVDAPGLFGQGYEYYAAHIAADAKGRSCGGPERAVESTGAETKGEVTEFRIRAPRRGWCPGKHGVSIRLHGTYIDELEDCSSADQPESGSSQCEYHEVERHDVSLLARTKFFVRQ